MPPVEIAESWSGVRLPHVLLLYSSFDTEFEELGTEMHSMLSEVDSFSEVVLRHGEVDIFPRLDLETKLSNLRSVTLNVI